jgi:hypothetical protein
MYIDTNSIESCFFQYLAKDIVLRMLLGATDSDPRIYYGKAQQPELDTDGRQQPFITYTKTAEGNKSETVLDFARFMFKISTENYDVDLANIIKDRLNEMLDMKQKHSFINIPSNTWFVKWVEKNGASDDYDDVRKQSIKIVNYDVIYYKQNFEQ